MEAGILFLIRWAMDEQIEAVYMVAIECLANLVAPRKDEVMTVERGILKCLIVSH